MIMLDWTFQLHIYFLNEILMQSTNKKKHQIEESQQKIK